MPPPLNTDKVPVLDKNQTSRDGCGTRLHGRGELIYCPSLIPELHAAYDPLADFRVTLDFEGVAIVGQGFADEVFRVWSRQHPEVLLIPSAMNEPVAFMVERAIRRRQESD